MDARGGGKVQGNVSLVAGFMLPRPQPQKAGGEDLADLGEPLGGGHQVRVEGVRRTIAERLRHGRELSADLLRRDTLEPSNPSPWQGVKRFNPAIRAC
jgi:hypothetical protein